MGRVSFLPAFVSGPGSAAWAHYIVLSVAHTTFLQCMLEAASRLLCALHRTAGCKSGNFLVTGLGVRTPQGFISPACIKCAQHGTFLTTCATVQAVRDKVISNLATSLEKAASELKKEGLTEGLPDATDVARAVEQALHKQFSKHM